jgi:hypothetical protein
MRRNLVRIILFIILLIFLFIINMTVFRSSFPLLWFVTFIGSVIGLIYFPYNKFFKIK